MTHDVLRLTKSASRANLIRNAAYEGVKRPKLRFLFHLKDLTPAIGPAIGADLMRRDLGLAGGAGDQVRAMQRIMRAAAVASAFGNFALGMGGHV